MPTANQIKATIDAQITNKNQAFSISNTDVGNRLKDIVDLTVPLQFNSTADRVNYLINANAQPFQLADDLEDGNKYFINKTKTGWVEVGGGIFKNNSEIILFSNKSELVIAWNEERQSLFGDSAHFVIETKDPDGKYRVQNGLEIVADNVEATTYYTIDLGGANQEGRITIK